MANHIIGAKTLAELKTMAGNDKNPVMLLGKDTIGDGFAAHYYWDDASTEAEDTVYYNIVQATNVTNGRWKKVIARVITVPQGILVYNGGIRTLYVNTTTGADGTATINLTMDNTTNGTAMFSNILFDDSKATVNTTTANDAVASCRKSLTNGNKQLTHLFYRGNNSTISLLGVNVLGFRQAVTGTPVVFMVTGV